MLLRTNNFIVLFFYFLGITRSLWTLFLFKEHFCLSSGTSETTILLQLAEKFEVALQQAGLILI